MLKKLKILKYIWVLGTFCTVGCTNGPAPEDQPHQDDVTPGSDEEQKQDEKEEDIVIETLKDGLKYINSHKNYTLTYQSQDKGKIRYTFEEKAIGRYASQSTALLSCYIEDEGGIYHLGYDDKYVSGEYLTKEDGSKFTSVWDKEACPNLFGLADSIVKKLSEDAETYVFKEKDYKMNFIKAVGYSDADYVNINTLTASFVSGSLVFALNMEGEKGHFYYLDNVGSTKNEEVQSFLEMGKGALTPDDELKTFRRLMRGNNFIRSMYDISVGEYGGIEVFHPHYFYTEMTGSSSGSGCISFVQKANESHDFDLKGSYYYTTTGSYPGKFTGISIMPQAFSDNPDVTKVYHYPTYMKILDSLEYFREGSPAETIYTPRGKNYYVANNEMLTDFINNFSLQATYDPSTFTPLNFEIDIIEGKDDASTEIMFIYNFLYQNRVYADFMPFKSFGEAGCRFLDNVYEAYND